MDTHSIHGESNMGTWAESARVMREAKKKFPTCPKHFKPLTWDGKFVNCPEGCQFGPHGWGVDMTGATPDRLVQDGTIKSRNGKYYQYVKGFFGYRWKRLRNYTPRDCECCED